MNLNDLANLGQIIGALAVVISLIYVALQIRQNTNAVRSAAAQVVHEHFASWYHLLASDESLSQVAIDGLKDYGSLSGKDKARFVAAFMAFLAYSQNAFLKWREKMLGPQLWMGWELLIMNLVSSPGGKGVLERTRLPLRRGIPSPRGRRPNEKNATPRRKAAGRLPYRSTRQIGPSRTGGKHRPVFRFSSSAEERMEQRGQVRHGR